MEGLASPKETGSPEGTSITDSLEFDWSIDDQPKQLKSPPVPVSAIFVHAGAGYHSTANEQIHLSACNRQVSP